MQLLRIVSVLVIGACLVPFSGCDNSGGGFGLVPAGGSITLGGEPVANAHVTFQPMAVGTELAGPISEAITDASGNFTLRTIQGEEGAIAKTHRVSVRIAGRDEQAEQAEETESGTTQAANQSPSVKIPVEWGEGNQEIEIPAAGNTQIKIEM